MLIFGGCPKLHLLLSQSYLIIAFALILLYWSTNLLIFLTINPDKYNDLTGFHSDEQLEIILFQDYQKWLLVSIFVSVPMWIYIFLDLDIISASRTEKSSLFWREAWKRTLIAASLFMPSLADYCAIVYCASWSLLSHFHQFLIRGQVIAIIGALLCSLFDHRIDSNNKVGNLKLNFLEQHTLSILISFNMGNLLNYILLVLSVSVSTGAAYYVINLFYLFGTAQLAYLCAKALWILSNNILNGRFEDDHHMFDFCHLLALTVYALVYSILQILSRYTPPDGTESVTIATVILRIAITVALKVIPTRCYKLSSELKQERLENRLNLIRYLSHEMRTPINTVFIGLDYIINEMKRVKEDILYLPIPLPSSTERLGAPNEEPPSGERQQPGGKIDEILVTAHHVLDSCHTALETLNDLLTLDKIDDGKFEVSTSLTKPGKIIESCAGPFSIHAREKKIQFSVRYLDLTATSAEENGVVFNQYLVEVDTFKISQVIRNLLSNALKFTPPCGSVSVTAQVLVHDPKTSKVDNADKKFQHILRVSVTDSGPGISAEDQKKLFGKYVQFNAGALQSGKGSGLGLWISRKIVELHGGILDAHSDGVGKGSTFFMDLPLYVDLTSAPVEHAFNVVVSSPIESNAPLIDLVEGEDDHKLDGDTSSSLRMSFVSRFGSNVRRGLARQWPSYRAMDDYLSPTQSQNSSTPKRLVMRERREAKVFPADSSVKRPEWWKTGLTILIVDDSLTNRKVLLRLLTSFGHKVSESVDGLDFLTIMGCDTRQTDSTPKFPFFHVILIDDNMPNMNGSEAVRIVRQRGYTGLILGITGDVDPLSVEKFRKEGANDVLPKPVDIEDLKLRIEDFFQSSENESGTYSSDDKEQSV